MTYEIKNIGDLILQSLILSKFCRIYKVFINNSKKAIYFLLSLFFYIIRNIFFGELRNKCTVKYRYFKTKLYNYYTTPDYCKNFGIPEESYDTEAGKMYVLYNFTVNAFSSCTYMNDTKNNVLLESFPSKDLSKLDWYDYRVIKYKKSDVIDVDEAVNLAVKWGNNFWHFTMTLLNKVCALEEQGYKGKYLVLNAKFINELMVLAGVSEDRLIVIKPKNVYRVKKLHIIDDYCDFDNIVLSNKVRERILGNIDLSNLNDYPKKIFIRRLGDYPRKVKNEKDVIDLLKKYNFEMIFPDDFSVEEQIKYFYAAEVVVAPHGACSTNVLYMRPNTHFVECFSFGWFNPCMLHVIKDNDMHYHMITKREDVNNKNRDYEIDILLLEDTIYKFASLDYNSHVKSYEKE